MTNAVRYLFRCRCALKQCAVVIKTADSLCFRNVCEEDLDTVLND